MKKIEKTIELAGRKLTLSTGDIAEQATGAVLATHGETVVLATVVSAPLREDLGYFPLSVDYKERLSAGGKIKGSRWVKRDGRPTDEEILTARLIDRSIRPLFPENYKKEVQVIVQVLSVDGETAPDMVAGIAVSAAIEASEIPWVGPVAMVRVGANEDGFLLNPKVSEAEKSEMDLVVSSVDKAIVMIEAGANQVSEDKILSGLDFGQKEGKTLLDFIKKFAKEVGKTKEKLGKEEKNAVIEKKVKDLALSKVKELIKGLATKEASYFDLNEVKKAVIEELGEENKIEISKAFEALMQKELRTMILSGKRADGRKAGEIRSLSSKVGVLPKVHGSAIFSRGQTQALTVATLGAGSLEQLIETAEGEESKRYIHHYSMPPYSVGETGRFGFPSRREIGHGALAERALLPVIPSESDFPYTIHVVTEILSSNGSTSMASTCGSTLSLMDAGVPIKAPVAGIAMGLVVESEKEFVVLTDIVGLEDGNGDMDFKVAGTKDGVTALQLDVKTLKLTAKILKEAFKEAKKARLAILANMEKAIKTPREKVSEEAPKIKTTTIPQEKIGELIGPGGKVIKKLMLDTGTEVNVEDDGKVSIAGKDDEKVNEAISWVENLVKEPIPGEIYDGEVKRLMNFGAFVEILPGKEGLVHVSDMSEDFVKNPEEIVKVGDKIKVRVKEIDKMGRTNLSMILDASKDKKQRPARKSFEPRQKSYRRGDSAPRGRGRNSGPHFPTSRLVEKNEKDFSR